MRRRQLSSHTALRAGLAGGILLAPVFAGAQDALRNTLQGEQWLARRQQLIEQQPYNLRWGDWRLLAELSFDVRYDDNVNFSENNAEADLILRPGGRLVSVLPITERNALTFDLGVGYLGYLDNSSLSRLTVEPGSVLSFDVFVGEVRLNVHDRFSYLDDPLETGPVSDESRFGGLYNTAGVSAHWRLNEMRLELGYDYSLFRPSVERYEYLDRDSQAVFLRVAGQVAPELEAGLEASAGLVEYDLALLSNNQNVSAGPFLDWRLTEHFAWSLRGGYVRYHYLATGASPPPDDTDGFYFETELNHELNERVGQSLSLVRSFEQGVNSELLDRWQVRHEVNWRFIRDLPLRTLLFYESGVETGSFAAEDYRRFGASLVATRSLGRNLSLRFEYAFTRKDSELPDRDYTNNRVLLGAFWRF